MSWLDAFKERRGKERTQVKFDTDVPYDVLEVDRKAEGISETNPVLTRCLIQGAVAARFPQTRDPGTGKLVGGLKGGDRKTWGRLQQALTVATDPKSQKKNPDHDTTIEIDEVTLDFVRECLEKWESPSDYSSWITSLEEALDALKDEARAAKERERAEKKAAAEKNGSEKPEKLAKAKG